MFKPQATNIITRVRLLFVGVLLLLSFVGFAQTQLRCLEVKGKGFVQARSDVSCVENATERPCAIFTVEIGKEVSFSIKPSAQYYLEKIEIEDTSGTIKEVAREKIYAERNDTLYYLCNDTNNVKYRFIFESVKPWQGKMYRPYSSRDYGYYQIYTPEELVYVCKSPEYHWGVPSTTAVIQNDLDFNRIDTTITNGFNLNLIIIGNNKIIKNFRLNYLCNGVSGVKDLHIVSGTKPVFHSTKNLRVSGCTSNVDVAEGYGNGEGWAQRGIFKFGKSIYSQSIIPGNCINFGDYFDQQGAIMFDMRIGGKNFVNWGSAWRAGRRTPYYATYAFRANDRTDTSSQTTIFFNFGRVKNLAYSQCYKGDSIYKKHVFCVDNEAVSRAVEAKVYPCGESPAVYFTPTNSQMVDSSFMRNLLGDSAEEDFIFEDGFYPRLRHMDERPGRLAASPILFARGENADSIKHPFYVDTNYGVRWISLSPGLVDIVGDSGYVRMPVAEDSVVRIEAWKEDFSKHVYLTIRARSFVDKEIGYDTVCHGDSVWMKNTYARNEGWNYDVVWGEGTDTSPDTVYRLHLHHKRVYRDTLHFEVARDSLPYIYKEDTIKRFGLTELHRYLTIEGCDSIIYVQLDTLDNRREIHHWDTLCLCSGDTSVRYWRGVPITGVGEVYDEVIDPYKGGIDTFYHLQSYISPTYRDTLYFLVERDSLPYIHGKDTIRQFGWTTLKALTVHGCDSVTYVRLDTLYIHREQHFYDTLHTCEGGALSWRGREITQTGDYADTVFDPYKGGTDSIHHLRADIYPTYYDTLHFSAEADSLPYILGKDTIRNFGLTELHRHQTVHGCDSVTYVRLDTLYIHREQHFYDTLHTCEGRVLSWRGREITQTGDYADTVFDPYRGGTDSIHHLRADIYPTYYDTLHFSAEADSLPYIYGKDTIRNFGLTELHRHQSVHGCDSITYVQLDTLYIHREQHFYDTLQTCQGDTLHWRGREITQTGEYADTVFDPYRGGTDSIHHLRADIYPVYHLTFTDSCYIEELPYRVGDVLMENFGNKTERYVTTAGCDSVREYSLLRRWHHYSVSVRVRGAGAANVSDTVLREDGSLWLAFTASSCHKLDSMRIDGRNVPPQSRYELKDLHGDCEVEAVFGSAVPTERVLRYEVCGDSLPIIYNGEAYGAGEHTIVLQTAQGCDSVVRLQVQGKENAARIAVLDTIAPPCGASEIAFSYHIEAGSPKYLRLMYDAAAQSAGFRDTTMAITSMGQQTVHIALPPSARPDRYGLQLWQADGTGCYAAEEVLTFEIPYPSDIIVQKWNDVLAVLSSEYNGGYEFSGYQWYKNGELLEGETRPYIYVKPYLRSTDTYAVLLERASDGLQLQSCGIKRKSYPKELTLELRPNPTSAGGEVQVSVNGKPEAEGIIEVFDGTGKPVYEKAFRRSHTLRADWQPGSYVVRVRDGKGSWTATGKLLVL